MGSRTYSDTCPSPSVPETSYIVLTDVPIMAVPSFRGAGYPFMKKLRTSICVDEYCNSLTHLSLEAILHCKHFFTLPRLRHQQFAWESYPTIIMVID